MTTDNASQSAPTSTVGERLRQAREVAGLTVTEVAARQHLRPVVIEAIESGDYRRIDSELFLKGYVRAYAAHVGVDPESVLRQLDKELEPLREEQKARVEASPLVTIERRKRRKRRIAKVVVVLLVLGGLFYGVSLYLASRDAPLSDNATEAEESSNEAAQAEPGSSLLDSGEDRQSGALVEQPPESLVIENDPAAASEDDVLSASAASDGEQGVSAETGDAPVADPDEQAVGEEAAISPETSQPAGPDESVNQGSRLAEANENESITTTVLSDTDAGISSTPASNEGRLIVEFSDDCWVEVQDSAGRTLVAELRRSGETLDVTGNAPIRVVLGAVSSVSSVSYSGESVGLADRRTRNDRLVLNLPD